MSTPRRVGLYYDEDCTKPIPETNEDGRRVYSMDFGRLDSGQEKTGAFYIWNQTDGLIQDLQITVHPPDREGIHVVMLSDRRVPRFEAGQRHKVYVKWTAVENVYAGRCTGRIDIQGWLTKE